MGRKGQTYAKFTKQIPLSCTPEMKEFLDTKDNRSRYIREAIQEKKERETLKK